MVSLVSLRLFCFDANLGRMFFFFKPEMSLWTLTLKKSSCFTMGLPLKLCQVIFIASFTLKIMRNGFSFVFYFSFLVRFLLLFFRSFFTSFFSFVFYFFFSRSFFTSFFLVRFLLLFSRSFFTSFFSFVFYFFFSRYFFTSKIFGGGFLCISPF
jgi:hypothetical protein